MDEDKDKERSSTTRWAHSVQGKDLHMCIAIRCILTDLIEYDIKH